MTASRNDYNKKKIVEISSRKIRLDTKTSIEHNDKDIALHIKQLFHCPNKSLEDAMGQNKLRGIINATATKTLYL